MKIKVTVKENSAGAKVVNAFKAQKEAFKQVVQSGKVNGNHLAKSRKVATL